jgi:L-ascorbate metabolism protein UlaG (beta-lactamase superfamily)
MPRTPAGALVMTWIGHSTFLIQIGGMNVLTDPIWSERASPLSFAGPRRRVPALPRLEELPSIDVIIISHDHYDHLDRGTVRRLAQRHPKARWLVPLGVARIVSRFGACDVQEMDWWEERECGALKIACTPAQHWSGRGAFDRGRSLWCGWTIRAGQRAVWFAGDTAWHPDIATIGKRLGPFDALLLPIGGIEPRWYMRRLHLDPDEAVKAFLAVQSMQESVATFVAMHWGTFRIADEALSVPPALLCDAWHRGGLPDERLWLLAHGETRTLSNPARVSGTIPSKPASMTPR